jgi:hypothetical protein
MNWEHIELQYKILKHNYDAAWNEWIADPCDQLYCELSIAKSQFELFCVKVLEQLMEQNTDVLQRLKIGG